MKAVKIKMKNKLTVKKLTVMALMVALEIILHRFLSIQTPIVQLHFGFLPVAIVAMLYGPIYAAVTWGVADFLGMLIAPTGGGSWFPGFTISLILSGLLFGLLLYKRKGGILNVIIAVVAVNICFTLCKLGPRR